MQSPDSYRKAFIQYLRKGTPVAYSLATKQKAENATRYVWRTRGDGKVRLAHAENNGKIFDWDSPPPTGHPGVDYGCRCVAEPYKEGETEYAYQELISYVGDAPHAWQNSNFLGHFLLGLGRGVTLEEIGHKKGIIDYFFYTLGKYDSVNDQIINEARKHTSGPFGYFFENSYNFQPYLYSFGDGVVAGFFSGSVEHSSGKMRITGSVEYFYSDVFTDPVSAREFYRGTSDVEAMWYIEKITEGGGEAFSVIGNWKTLFKAETNLFAGNSHYAA